MHKSFFSFLKAIDNAISGASGILIQFPLYFGIMGIMNSSGLVDLSYACISLLYDLFLCLVKNDSILLYDR